MSEAKTLAAMIEDLEEKYPPNGLFTKEKPGIHLKRDKLPSIFYSEMNKTSAKSIIHPEKDHYKILGQNFPYWQGYL
ncbi:MAG: hypothetical protein GY820_17100 [Gammaproteobacteria bacterium]|nr:hypothetical protein [Gammaproteobacteria bacterium]